MKVDITKKIFSIFLAISWLIVLFFLLYPFFKDNATPNFWLLLILVVLPLLMLVQKLKIGSFFDFSKSDSTPYQTPITIGQQINLSVMGQESAKAFVESITTDLEHQTKQLNSSFQNKYSKYIRLNHSIDLILITSLPTIRAYYSFIMTMVQDKPLKISDDNLKKSMGIEATIALLPEKEIDYSSVLLLIEIIQANIKSVFASSTEELSLNFSNIRKLIELRTSIASTTEELKFNEETFGILLEALKSSGSLSGFLAGNWEMLRLSMKTLLQSTNKPINKSSNK
ncbi:hypothetical protein ACFLUY_01505 [Chloroflexota bacterium]